LIVRFVLEKCASAAEARDVLLKLPFKEPKSYLIADKKEASVVEAHPELREVRNMEYGLLIVTNHFAHPSMTAFQKGWPNSISRYNRLKVGAEQLTKVAEGDTAFILQQLMADHEAPLCGP
jgi:predicted choloylglycine hydrolase